MLIVEFDCVKFVFISFVMLLGVLWFNCVGDGIVIDVDFGLVLIDGMLFVVDVLV